MVAPRQTGGGACYKSVLFPAPCSETSHRKQDGRNTRCATFQCVMPTAFLQRTSFRRFHTDAAVVSSVLEWHGAAHVPYELSWSLLRCSHKKNTGRPVSPLSCVYFSCDSAAPPCRQKAYHKCHKDEQVSVWVSEQP